MPKCDFSKVAKLTFQNIFFLQHLWVAASVSSTFSCACQLNIRTDIKEIKDIMSLVIMKMMILKI